MQETVQEKAPERPAQAGQLKASTGTAAAPPFVDNRPSTAAQLKLAQMVQAAPQAVAQRRQMSVITGATAQLEEEDEPLQGKAEPLQRVQDEAQATPPPPPPPPPEVPAQNPPVPEEAVQHPIMEHPQVPQQEGGANPTAAPQAPDAEQAAVEQAGAEQLALDPNGAANPTAAPQVPVPEQAGEAPVQHPIMAPAEQEAVPEQHPIQHPAEPTQAPPEQAQAPVQNKADPAQRSDQEPAQLQAGPVRQFAFVRTWGDEEPEKKAPAAPQAEAAVPEAAAAAPQAPAKKPGFFERMKNGVKNVAGNVGRALLNWSGQGKPPAAAAGAARPQQPGAQPAPVQAPAGPKVYVPNEKRVSARRVPSRAPVTGRAAAANENRDMMMERMRGPAAPAAANANAAAGANPAAAAGPNPAAAAFASSVISGQMRSNATNLMKQGLSAKVGALAAAEEGPVAGKLTAANYAVAGQSYSGEQYAGAAATAAKAAAKASGA